MAKIKSGALSKAASAKSKAKKSTAKAEKPAASKRGKSVEKVVREFVEEERLEEDEEIDSGEDEGMYAMEDDSDGDAEASDPKASERMLEIAEKLDTMGRASAPRRKVLQGSSQENSFAAVAPAQSKVSLLDLLGEDEGQTQLKKRLSKLEGEKVPEIAPPISKTQQDRAERGLMYEQAKNRMDDWEPLVTQNRRQKLSFPLNEASLKERPSLQTVVAKQKPDGSFNDAEKEIMEALKASGLASEKQVLDREQEALNALGDDEEAKRRHAELAKMRMLMFYSEQKAKRVKKIKSKTFRRLRKKRLRREEEEALERLKTDDPEAYKAYEEKLALERAKERMDLRKKNNSKNVREMHLKHRLEAEGVSIDDSELVKRMRTIRSGDSDEESDDEDDEDDLTTAERHLQEVENDLKSGDADKIKGIMGLKFMQRAADREKQEALSEAKRLVAALKGDGDGGDEDEEVKVGRRKFVGDGNEVKRVRFDREEDDGPKPKTKAKPLFDLPDMNTLGDYADEEAPELETNGRTEEPASNANDDAEEESNPWLAPQDASSSRKAKAATSAPPAPVVSVKRAIENIDAQEEQLDEQEKERRAEQKELIRMAFADVITKDFEEEKRKLEEDEAAAKAESEGKMKVDGWGSWTGMGVKAPRPKKSADAKPEQAKPRASNGPSNVIVSTRTNKLQKKYQVEGVPYPFTSREQYERSLSEPIGPEWNTFKQFEKKVQPEVKVKPGAIIEPLKMSAGLKKKKKPVPNRKKL